MNDNKRLFDLLNKAIATHIEVISNPAYVEALKRLAETIRANGGESVWDGFEKWDGYPDKKKRKEMADEIAASFIEYHSTRNLNLNKDNNLGYAELAATNPEEYERQQAEMKRIRDDLRKNGVRVKRK